MILYMVAWYATLLVLASIAVPFVIVKCVR